MYQQDEVADYKTYIDQIYGACKLSPLIAIIIKQPEFYRMRKIKQLGCADYVYSTAIGNRFQHSVGTAILTKRLLADYLLTDQKERNLYDIQGTGFSSSLTFIRVENVLQRFFRKCLIL